jgi:hypothetical protein
MPPIMVLTIMPPNPGAHWQGNARMAVGQALLAAGENGMTAAEMAFIAQQHQSNLKKAAEDLVREGVLRRTPPPTQDGRRGRKARVAFAFAEGERQRFEELVAEETPIGMLGVGTQLVVVDAEENPSRLAEVLSRSDLIGNLAWAAHVNGRRSEIWLAYEGREASDDSRDLMAAFDAAELSAARSSVAKLASVRDLTSAEERKRQRIERIRTQLQADRPSFSGRQV